MYCCLCGCFLPLTPDDLAVCSVCRQTYSEEDVSSCKKTLSPQHSLSVPDYYPDIDDSRCQGCGAVPASWNGYEYLCNTCENSRQDDTSCVFCDSRNCHAISQYNGSDFICDRCEGIFLRLFQVKYDHDYGSYDVLPRCHTCGSTGDCGCNDDCGF